MFLLIHLEVSKDFASISKSYSKRNGSSRKFYLGSKYNFFFERTWEVNNKYKCENEVASASGRTGGGGGLG